MKNNISFNVLIQVRTQNEVKPIIDLFRSAGMTTRIHRVTSEQDFKEHLKNHDWDLLIADNRHPEASLTASLKAIKAAGLHLPTILLSNDNSAEFSKKAYDLGIADVIDSHCDERLLHAAQREMSNVFLQRQLSNLQKDYDELKIRSGKLLSESDNAIAYIADGIIIQANDNFSNVFAFDNIDDLDCAAIIDLVSADDQTRFKNFIKLSGHETKNDQLQFTAIKNNGDSLEAFLNIKSTILDGEPCTQLSFSSSASNDGNNDSGSLLDSASNLHNRYYLTDQLSSVALQTSKGNIQASLLLYRIDNSNELLGDIQLRGMDKVIRDMATHINTVTSPGDIIARIGSDAIAVIMQRNSDNALEAAKETLTTIEKHILELGSRTIQYTCTCTVLALSSKDADYLIDQSFVGIHNIRLKKAKNHAAIHIVAAPKAARINTDHLSNIEEAFKIRKFSTAISAHHELTERCL